MIRDALKPTIYGDAIAVHRVADPDRSGRATVIELDAVIEPAERIADLPANRIRQTEAKGCPHRRIAHDFNNLLGVITLNLELAREHAACSCELRRLIDEALDAAWQGAALTSRMPGRLDAGAREAGLAVRQSSPGGTAGRVGRTGFA